MPTGTKPSIFLARTNSSLTLQKKKVASNKTSRNGRRRGGHSRPLIGKMDQTSSSDAAGTRAALLMSLDLDARPRVEKREVHNLAPIPEERAPDFSSIVRDVRSVDMLSTNGAGTQDFQTKEEVDPSWSRYADLRTKHRNMVFPTRRESCTLPRPIDSARRAGHERDAARPGVDRTTRPMPSGLQAPRPTLLGDMATTRARNDLRIRTGSTRGTPPRKTSARSSRT